MEVHVYCDVKPRFIRGVYFVDQGIVQVAIGNLASIGVEAPAELSPDVYSPEEYARRVLGTMRHELLHMLGLEHCTETTCVMFATAEKDRGDLPCRRCLGEIGSQPLIARWLVPDEAIDASSPWTSDDENNESDNADVDYAEDDMEECDGNGDKSSGGDGFNDL
jgi:hypothetical protein